jgi:hypothetical protein
MVLAVAGMVAPRLAVARTRHRAVTRERVDSEVVAGPLVPALRYAVTVGADGWIQAVAGAGMGMERRAAVDGLGAPAVAPAKREDALGAAA